ncbi:putative transferase, protein kinase RLK-Pelle-RLCK-IXb family [Helianthus annuus]|uniref:RING-type E3 ubiquitin transferase n=1 Tax=Helianthus annuus TaxID=4232 RepID=A0A251UK14_HELAN|nr:U-box domain-containing protein 33 [Helianthus annuus]KAF5802517.1 putative transferase, protein kinase RLK-Pelle-RLCK-IXb family [Helianthus annuus]KAJ0573665.1 putative transferase, protein kinase RLK-Pelle-RLCK-IXb family [Helianthus annuus]KAJ0911999.1 putative transferase, protein kinase RLK-Pelle-RLCK-IXb family [Helianthus annuus]
MKLLRPSHPSATMVTGTCSGFSPPATFRDGFGRNIPPVPEIVGGGDDKVYVAVGKSVEKAVALFHWTFRRFRDREICILHVHQPSPLIPTLLGKLPATQANPDVVCAYRREERDAMQKLLLDYVSLCARSKVKACVVTTENDQVRKGIVDLVNEYRVQKLVMGAATENWMKVKKNSSKSSYAAKNAPPFCQIWFVNKGQLLHTREPSEDYNILPPSVQDSSALRSQSLHCPNTEREIPQIYCRSSSSTSFIPRSTSMTRSLQSNTSSESEYSSEHDLRVEEESLCKQLDEVNLEAEASRNEAFQELLKRKRLEAQALEANNKVKAYESAHAQEVELRKAAEDKLNAARRENEQLLEQRESTSKEWHKLLRNIAILENQVQEANRRREESSEELKLIQASVATLKIEKLTLQRQRFEAANWLDRWKVRGQPAGASSTTSRLTEFSLVDLETATCGFSESFKIGCESYGCSLYKGEMSNRTVMIKKLHRNNLQAQQEFQEEVQVVGRLKHKHILSLIGICHEAHALVYEYTPTRLESHLSHKTNSYSMSWKTRTRVIFEIANALLFLHSSRPEKLLHGNLSPENIVLDSEFCCKLCNFRFSKLVNEETFRCRSFRQYSEPSSNGHYLFTDPEFLQTGDLTAKSDVYSFGMIILWLLTGSRASGLANIVRRAVSGSNLVSVLDASAGEWSGFVARRLADLGLRCCDSNSADRPAISLVMVKELEHLSALEDRRVPSSFLCPILKEIMHDPQLAADGFTYEGEALRGWLKNGRETSPMTNLKLDHLNLTPNHSIRLAIQDWLCNP